MLSFSILSACPDNAETYKLSYEADKPSELNPISNEELTVWTVVLPSVANVQPTDYQIMEIKINRGGVIETVTVVIVGPDNATVNEVTFS